MTYAELARFLEGLGFSTWRGHRPKDAPWPGPDTFRVWEHPQFPNARLLLPDFKDEDDLFPYTLGVVRSTLVHHGVMSADDFDRWRLGLTPPPSANGAKKASRPRKSRAADGGRKKP